MHCFFFILISRLSCLPLLPACSSLAHFLLYCSPHPPGSSLLCICHFHSPSLFISRLYISVYPGSECHKQLGRSHSLLVHLLAWSPISLYRHCHLFYCIIPPLLLGVPCAHFFRLCHHLDFSTDASTLITFFTQGPSGAMCADFIVKSMSPVQSGV